jgi:HEAT repeat protein
VKQCAARKLAALGLRALPYLLPLLEHRDWAVRDGAAAALGGMKSDARDAVPSLIAAYDKDPAPWAGRALSQIADPRALDVLIRHIDELGAAELLRPWGAAIGPGLVGVLEDPDSSMAALNNLQAAISSPGLQLDRGLVARLHAALKRELARPVLARAGGRSCQEPLLSSGAMPCGTGWTPS